jgi:hypothetical protein
MRDNPVIGYIRPSIHNFHNNSLPGRNPHPRVGNQGYLELVTLCDAIHLLFHGAGIGINIDMQQRKSFRYF